MRHVLTCLAFFALSSPALAACTDNWARPSAETLAMNDGTEFRIARYDSLEARLLLVQNGRRVEVLFTRAGYLIKGVPEAELQKFAEEAHWLMLFSEPAASAVWQAVEVAPCSAAGTYEIAQPVHVSFNLSGAPKLLRATGQAVADGQGLIRYAIRFDTQPALPPGRALTAVGTLSFQDAGEAMPGSTDVGGFSVVSPDRPGFVAAPGTTLAQLPARPAPAR